ncbi:MAG TPA: sensor histidine kinase [Streptosporangiaceae bacterium]
MSALYAWLRRHQILVDSVLAALLFLGSFGQVVGRHWAVLPVLALMTVPVAFRRRFPIWAFAMCAAGGLWQLIIGLVDGRGGAVGADFAVVIMIYTVAAYRPRRYSLPVLGISLIGSAVAGVAWSPLHGAQWPQKLMFIGILIGGTTLLAWILGDSMRYRRGYYAALEDKAARLEAERDAQARIAAAAERGRIARELHDIVAHHVSVMVVQADGAGYALRSDPERAQAALAAISSTGRQALTEMRRLLGVLRSAGDQAALAPVPGLDELRELLDQARAAGMAVTHTLIGAPRELPKDVELAAYRVVQESLTNTRKHGGLAASAAVTLTYDPVSLTITVTDDGIATAQDGAGTGGHGLAGMRERIGAYGGTVQAGPLSKGGFGVVARIPCPAARQAPAPALAPVVAAVDGALDGAA